MLTLAAGAACADLVNFSDCDGIIGPVMAARLAVELRENRKKFASALVTSDDAEFLEKYEALLDLFEFAAPRPGFAVHLLVRMRALCLARRAIRAGALRHADTVHSVPVWLCSAAPLWVVVRVCALLRVAGVVRFC